MCNVYNKGTYPEGRVLVYVFTMDTERKAQREFLCLLPQVEELIDKQEEPKSHKPIKVKDRALHW